MYSKKKDRKAKKIFSWSQREVVSFAQTEVSFQGKFTKILNVQNAQKILLGLTLPESMMA
jgi:hypothetical protein